MARWPKNPETNAAEQTIGQESSVILPATGSIIQDDKTIVAAEISLTDDYAKSLQFMEEPVDVMVHESTDVNAENPVCVTCNGVNQYFVRGQSQTVRRKYVEILARAKATAIATREARNYDGELSTQINKMTALKYPFSVISDRNPNGAPWLKSVLAEA